MKQMKDDNLFAIAIGLWILGVMISLGVLGGIIYVAIHFISKFW